MPANAPVFQDAGKGRANLQSSPATALLSSNPGARQLLEMHSVASKEVALLLTEELGTERRASTGKEPASFTPQTAICLWDCSWVHIEQKSCI